MPGLDDMMTELRNRADGVRGSFDVGAIASAGRRRVRRRRAAIGGALAVVSAVVLGGGTWGLITWIDQEQSRTNVATQDVGPSTAPEEVAPVQVSVDTSGWLTFSSPQYPMTFRYPPDWTINVSDGLDGCSDSGFCVLFLNPPTTTSGPGGSGWESSGTALIRVTRNGFSQGGAMWPQPEPSGAEVVGSVPGLTGWSADGQGPGQVVVLKVSHERGAEYTLGVAGSTVTGVAFGDGENPTRHAETFFSLETDTVAFGGEISGDHGETVLAVLASIQPNVAFAPTLLEDLAAFPKMSTPTIGAVTPDPSWKTFTSQAGNVTVRYPSTWSLADDGEVVWIVAPSGYIVDLLTNESGGPSCDTATRPVEDLGTASQVRVTSQSGAGSAEIRWYNGGSYPVWVGLTQSRPEEGCFDDGLDFGGRARVYLGSADNWKNPTPQELDQVLAILASAQRAS